MPPKRKTAPASGSAAKKPAAKKTAKSNKSQPARRIPKLAAQLDMYIRRSDDEDDESDAEPIPSSSSTNKQQPQASADDMEVEYEPESDEASHISSSEGEDNAAIDSDDDDLPKVKTVSAANLAFLEGLDRNKAINVSQKDAKQKAKDLKRSDRREFEEARKRIAAENKAKLTQPVEESEDEQDFSDEDFSDEDVMEEQEVRNTGEKKNYQEYSDVSEGEEVDASSDEDVAPAKTSKKANKGKGEDEDTEAAYLARLGKRKARQQYEDEMERKKRVNAKLPIRKLDDEASADSSDEDEEEDEMDAVEQGDREESEPEGLGSDADSDSDDEDASSAKPTSRAVHKPLPHTVAAASDSEDEPTPIAPITPHSSITHSARFNLTAPYDIVLTSHPCRLPPPPSASSNRKAVLSYKSTLANAQKQTLLLARNQIASLSSQIVADPEVNLGLLRRLAVFASPTISAPPEKIPEIRAEQAAAKADKKSGGKTVARPIKVEVAPAIRQLAMLSMLAVFVDILPGYRIRPLTEKEQEEKVGQEVARRREFEAGLVGVYRDFLEMCEAELKAASSALSGSAETFVKNSKKAPAPGVGKLEKISIKVFTTLAVRAVHFNFRQNILGVVIARMSRRTWGDDEKDCYEAIKSVVVDDRTGEVSLEVVRLIHRMTKERRYKVNSRVLDILLHLRLRDELGNKRSSTTNTTDPDAEAAQARREAEERRAAMKAREGKKGKGGGKGSKSKDVRKGLATHLSKKQVKKQKELRAIEDEMKEAEATIDLEERERNQTETLKLVFVLYFTVLKAPVGSVALGVLESTLGGLSLYAHRVNVDFFRDLLNVLKQHVTINASLLEDSVEPQADQEDDGGESDSDDEGENVLLDQTTLTKTIRHIIVALKTTFDLFLGQVEGSILNLDLTDVLGHFYYVLFFLPFVNELHLQLCATSSSSSSSSSSSCSVVDLALDSVYAILVRSRARFAPNVLASFAKRLAIVSLHLPVSTSSGPRKVLGLIGHVLTKQSTSASAGSQLALLDLEDRSRNGNYQHLGKNLNTSAVLESGQSILWELAHLQKLDNADVTMETNRVWALKDSQ
ncbi:related to NOC3 protein, required for maturation and intranuclear transport of pre-ribosomes [Ustilago trichophora]|uniref:Related to NOC3 protein, required for maturation and intranuclear transport of pre-ribosomes n=1 Tax=Ustilago trichophora TaxID=86804 RepID=A0A5C3EPH1_9BASI|nr:related to NOC3 protein, required for maturation and intranuclear transport of pre-ribosomes [Ustilago trichophora]